MAKYQVNIPYIGWKYYEVEAENEEDAINKAFEENEIEENLSLCWNCSQDIDSDLILDEKEIYADEV